MYANQIVHVYFCHLKSCENNIQETNQGMSNEHKTLGLQSDRVSRAPLCDQYELLQHIHKHYITNTEELLLLKRYCLDTLTSFLVFQ